MNADAHQAEIALASKEEGPLRVKRPFIDTGWNKISRLLDDDRDDRRGASSRAWVRHRDLGGGRRGDVGRRNVGRQLRRANKLGGAGRAVPFHNRTGNESGAVHRENKVWASGNYF